MSERNGRKRSSRWDRATPRALAILAAEFAIITPQFSRRSLEITGVTSMVLESSQAIAELHRLVALAICLKKEELLVTDIGRCRNNIEPATKRIAGAAARITTEIGIALADSGVPAAPIRLSRDRNRFDLRVYLSGIRPTRSPFSPVSGAAGEMSCSQ